MPITLANPFWTGNTQVGLSPSGGSWITHIWVAGSTCTGDIIERTSHGQFFRTLIVACTCRHLSKDSSVAHLHRLSLTLARLAGTAVLAMFAVHRRVQQRQPCMVASACRQCNMCGVPTHQLPHPESRPDPKNQRNQTRPPLTSPPSHPLPAAQSSPTSRSRLASHQHTRS
jgi:hypothetical protein